MMELRRPTVRLAVIIAFITPYVAVGSGLVTAWLFVHFHWLGVFNVYKSGVQQAIFGSIVFAVTSGLTYAAAHWHWLPVVIQRLAPHPTVVPGPATKSVGPDSTRL